MRVQTNASWGQEIPFAGDTARDVDVDVDVCRVWAQMRWLVVAVAAVAHTVSWGRRGLYLKHHHSARPAPALPTQLDSGTSRARARAHRTAWHRRWRSAAASSEIAINDRTRGPIGRVGFFFNLSVTSHHHHHPPPPTYHHHLRRL